MIKNERQFKIAKSNLEKWLKNRAWLEKAPENNIPDFIVSEQSLSINEQIRKLQDELKEYEDTASGAKVLTDPSVIDEIPKLLIGWRIARNLTQRQLAERAGIHENLLQKYELENYGCASYNTIAHMAHVLRDAGD